jgi:hypothetical protein
MRQTPSDNTPQSQLAAAEQWSCICVQTLKSAQAQGEHSDLGEEEAVYTAGITKLTEQSFKSHPTLVRDMIALINNRALRDQTRATAIDVLMRLAEPDPYAVSAQIARAEMRQADRCGAPTLPSPQSVKPAKPYTTAILNIIDDATESPVVRESARTALRFFQQRLPANMKTSATEIRLDSFRFARD